MADNKQNQWETHEGLPYFPVKLPSEMYSEKSLDINPAFRIIGGKLIINSDNSIKSDSKMQYQLGSMFGVNVGPVTLYAFGGEKAVKKFKTDTTTYPEFLNFAENVDIKQPIKGGIYG